MRCDEWNHLLDLSLDGELPEDTTTSLERHLMRCPNCAYELKTLEQTRQMLREAVAPQHPTDAFCERTTSRLLSALADRVKLPSHRPESLRQWTLPFAREEREVS